MRAVPDETVESYLLRLAAANHIPVTALAVYLGGRGSSVASKVSLAALATVSGQPAASLAYALPELGDQHPDRLCAARVYVASPAVGALCRRCAAARGIKVPVRVWVRPERKICLRHRMWIGDAVTGPDEQIDLADHPDVVHAQVRHYRLIRRFGRATMDTAYRCASEVWVDVTWRGYGVAYRTWRTLTPADQVDAVWRGHSEDAVYQAAHYPETLSLAAMIASAYWRQRAVSTCDGDYWRFHAELWRRLPAGYPVPQPWLGNLRVLLRHAAQQAGLVAPAIGQGVD